MDNSRRFNIGVNNRYHSYIKPYWRSRFQSGPVPVSFIREPFETQHAVWNSTPDMISFKKHKSKATLSRDKIRMQIFCENKNMCSALPFVHLDDTQMKEVISVQFDSQPDSRKSKLESASKRIKDLKASFNLLNSTIQLLYNGREDDCERVQELMKLQYEGMRVKSASSQVGLSQVGPGQLGPVISYIASYFPRYFHKGNQYEVCFISKIVQQKFEGLMLVLSVLLVCQSCFTRWV